MSYMQKTLVLQRKAELMQQVLAPIAANFSALMERMVRERDAAQQLAFAHSINNAMALAR